MVTRNMVAGVVPWMVCAAGLAAGCGGAAAAGGAGAGGVRAGDRVFVGADGTPLKKTPCPADPAFWNKSITRRAELIARISLDRPAISGLVRDDEMYGADYSNFQGYCYCPD